MGRRIISWGEGGRVRGVSMGLRNTYRKLGGDGRETKRLEEREHKGT